MLPPRALATESNSSKKRTQGAAALAYNSLRECLQQLQNKFLNKCAVQPIQKNLPCRKHRAHLPQIPQTTW